AFNPDDIQGCMGARALASIGDETSHRQWQHCETALAQVHALDGFALRYWSLLMASSFALVSAFGFALAVRIESRAPRVLRGRRLLTGEAARRAFLRTTKAESTLSGVGLELLPGLPTSSERETRHVLIQNATRRGMLCLSAGGKRRECWGTS